MSNLQNKVGIIQGEGGSDLEELFNRLLSMWDIHREFDYIEVNGLRKVEEIRFSSATLDAELGQTILATRAFTYDGAPDYDLADIDDSLSVT